MLEKKINLQDGFVKNKLIIYIFNVCEHVWSYAFILTIFEAMKITLKERLNID